MRAAGRALGLSQPTIARRLAAFEASFGGPSLFDRLPEGLHLNAAGEQLVSAAEGIEDAVLALERQRAAASPVLSGTVRVSTGECAGGFLARCLAGSTRTALPPGITLELVDELRQRANLVRRQADMALRHEPPESGDYYVAKLGKFGIRVGEGDIYTPADSAEQTVTVAQATPLVSLSSMMSSESVSLVQITPSPSGRIMRGAIK